MSFHNSKAPLAVPRDFNVHRSHRVILTVLEPISRGAERVMLEARFWHHI